MKSGIRHHQVPNRHTFPKQSPLALTSNEPSINHAVIQPDFLFNCHFFFRLARQGIGMRKIKIVLDRIEESKILTVVDRIVSVPIRSGFFDTYR